MYCKQCGAELTGSGKFCTKCGEPNTSVAKESKVQTEAVERGVPRKSEESQQNYQQLVLFNESMLPDKYKPIGMWGYFGWTLLFGIPFIGTLVAFIFSCGAVENVNLKNFARSFFCCIILLLVFLAVSGISLSALFRLF